MDGFTDPIRHPAEYRPVHDGGFFRFDYVPEGWDLRGSADEPFEAKADASDDDYDPGHIVEARPPHPVSPPTAIIPLHGDSGVEIAMEAVRAQADPYKAPPRIVWPEGIVVTPFDEGAVDYGQHEEDEPDIEDPLVALTRRISALEDAETARKLAGQMFTRQRLSPLGDWNGILEPSPRPQRRRWWRK